MEKLQLEFKGRGEVSGVMFYQIFRHENLCLYQRIDPDGFISYEVIRPIYQKASTANFGGVEINYPEREKYPKGDQWGATERGTQLLHKAINYFNQFVGEKILTLEMIQDSVKKNIESFKKAIDENFN